MTEDDLFWVQRPCLTKQCFKSISVTTKSFQTTWKYDFFSLEDAEVIRHDQKGIRNFRQWTQHVHVFQICIHHLINETVQGPQQTAALACLLKAPQTINERKITLGSVDQPERNTSLNRQSYVRRCFKNPEELISPESSQTSHINTHEDEFLWNILSSS